MQVSITFYGIMTAYTILTKKLLGIETLTTNKAPEHDNSCIINSKISDFSTYVGLAVGKQYNICMYVQMLVPKNQLVLHFYYKIIYNIFNTFSWKKFKN